MRSAPLLVIETSPGPHQRDAAEAGMAEQE
jgi:hypothetical protein